LQALKAFAQSTDRAVSRLSRARISFPVLKNGMAFCATRTSVPVRGLRPLRAPRILAEKGSETPKLDSIPATQSFDDFVKYGVDDVRYVSLVKVRVLRSDAPYQVGFWHVQPWLRGWQIGQMSVKQPSLRFLHMKPYKLAQS
jgi:hypothetical protein